jgi:hypothetical protein
MSKNTLKAVSILTERDNDGKCDWLVVRFWRKDCSRYHSTQYITDTSFKRLGHFMYANSKPNISRSSLSIDWYNPDQSVWNYEEEK